MQYIIDIVLLAVFVLIIVRSAKKGFGKIVLDLLATVLSFAAAYLFSRPAAEFLYEKIVKKMIENSIAEKLGESSAVSSLKQVQEVVAGLPDAIVAFSKSMGVGVDKLADSLTKADISAGNIAAVVTETVIRPVVILIMGAVCALLIFIVASIVFGLLTRLLNKVFKLPVLKSANKALGAALGVLKGIIFVLVICTLLYYLGGFTTGAFSKAVDNSKIVSLVNRGNPIIGRFNG